MDERSDTTGKGIPKHAQPGRGGREFTGSRVGLNAKRIRLMRRWIGDAAGFPWTGYREREGSEFCGDGLWLFFADSADESGSCGAHGGEGAGEEGFE